MHGFEKVNRWKKCFEDYKQLPNSPCLATEPKIAIFENNVLVVVNSA